MTTNIEDRMAVGIEEASRLLGVSTKTIRRAVWGGQIPATKIRGRYVIATDTIRKMLKIEEGQNAKSA